MKDFTCNVTVNFTTVCSFNGTLEMTLVSLEANGAENKIKIVV